MYEQSKPGFNFPLILAFAVVAAVAAVACGLVVRRRYRKREQKIQTNYAAQVESLESVLKQCQVELNQKAQPKPSGLIIVPPFSSN